MSQPLGRTSTKERDWQIKEAKDESEAESEVVAACNTSLDDDTTQTPHLTTVLLEMG